MKPNGLVLYDSSMAVKGDWIEADVDPKRTTLIQAE